MRVEGYESVFDEAVEVALEQVLQSGNQTVASRGYPGTQRPSSISQ